MTADLVAWLTQILDEDEKAAKRAGGSITEMQCDNYGLLLVPHGWVLDDIVAKRAIIARCCRKIEQAQGLDPTGCWEMISELAWATLEDIASGYATREGFREEWRP